MCLPQTNALLNRLCAEKQEGGSDSVLVCGDQVVTWRGKIREKPASEAEAREFISSYSLSDPCETVGALCVHDLQTGRRVSGVTSAKIHFESIPEEVVDQLAGDPAVRGCAGNNLLMRGLH